MALDTQVTTQADILAAFGVSAPAPGTPPAEDPKPAQDGAAPGDPAAPPAQSSPPPEEGADNGQEEGDPNEPPKTDKKPPAEDKSSVKFAEMRVQIRQFETVLSEIAQVLGLPETNDVNELLGGLKEAVIAAQSKKTGIAENVLRVQKQNTEELQVLRQENLANQTYTQLGELQRKLTLTGPEISNFVDALVEQGRNPFQVQLDLEREYRLLNYDTLLEKAKKTAIEAEQARAAKVTSHSSAPNGKQGTGGSGEKTQISTVKELDRFMETMKA